MRVLKLIAVAAFVALVPVFLVTSNVRWVTNFPGLYSYGYDKYNIPAYTGIERDELMSAGQQIRDYFNGPAEDITIRVVVRGILVDNLYNEREVLHMRDVKGLIRGVYRLQEISGAYLLTFAVVGLVLARRRFPRRLARYVGLGGIVTFGLIAAVGLGALVGFDRLFLAFHLVSFSNDLWQLDPRRDFLVAMFPFGFFFDATMLIALSTVAQAAILAALPVVVPRLRRPRRLSRQARRLAARAQGS